MRRITLLTDFGTRDGYVGAMKGVIAALAPGVVLDDISHDVAAGDTRAGARALGRYWRRFPGGTVHLIVVDPGVGTARRALAIEADRRRVVAPDNGVASEVIAEADEWRAVSLENPEFHGDDGSTTFHGRDLFAPVAAHLARGIHLSRLGPPVDHLVRLEEPAVRRDGQGVRGEVIAIDRFGNLITNVPGAELAPTARVEVEDRRIPRGRTYGDVARGDPVALVNSDDRLEIAVRDGSAAARLGAAMGTAVRVVTEAHG